MRRAVAAEELLVSERIDDAAKSGLKMQEETLTEMLHLGLARNLSTRRVIRARIFNRGEEGENGADWLWVFRGVDGNTVRLFVQAKRWDHKGGYSLGQLSAPSSPSVLLTQRDVLVAAGLKSGTRTAFAFYNPGGLIPVLYKKTCRWDSKLQGLGGVGLADAKSVHLRLLTLSAPMGGKVGKKRSTEVSQHFAWPLSCALFCWQHPQRVSSSETIASVVSDSLTASGIAEPVALSATYQRQIESLVQQLFDLPENDGVSDDSDSNDISGDSLDSDDRVSILLDQFEPLRLAGAMVVTESG